MVEIKNPVLKEIWEDRYKKGDETIQDNIHNKLEQKFGYKSLFQSPEFRKQYNGKTNKIEKNICQKIGGQKFYYKDKEYDIIVDNDIFEIDGDFWHPKEINTPRR